MRFHLQPILAGVGVLAVAAAAHAQSVDVSRADTRSSADGRAIVAADFNRDGATDVAQANGAGDSITVLLGRHEGGFAAPIDVPVGDGPIDLAAADVNRDARVDLIVANADSDSIAVLRGSGAGAFTRSTIATGAGSSPRGARVADMNQDGRPDIVFTGFGDGRVQVLLGNGAGGFTPGPAGAAVRPQGVLAADFNRDGRLDIAVAEDAASGLAVYLAGSSTLTATHVGGAANLSAVAAADFDADGWADVAAASTGRNLVAVYAGTPAGLVYRRSYAVSGGPRSIAVDDVDGDGRPDIVTANRASSSLSVLLGSPAAPGSFLSPIEVAVGQGGRAAALADFNHDGRVDVVTANQYAGTISLLTNLTPLAKAAYVFGAALLPVAAPIVDAGLADIVIADFDRDGRMDLATRGTDSIVVRLASGAETLVPAPAEYVSLRTADLNGDGNSDILGVLTNAGNLGDGVHTRVLVYLGTGRGGFSRAMVTESRLSLRCEPADLNRDGRPDLACMAHDYDANTQELQTLLGNGDGTFRYAAAVATGFAWDLQLADVNRDGRIDAMALEPPNVHFWWGTADGGWIHATPIASGVGHAQELRAGDLNHDGFVDLVVAGIFGELSVVLGAAGSFAAPSVSMPFASYLVDLAPLTDVDRDGHLDLVGYDAPAGRILRGTGAGTFEDPEGFEFWPPFAIGDLTGDGLPDIVRGYGNHQFRVLVSERSDMNHAPTVVTSDRVVNYQHAIYDCAFLDARVSDADFHAVTVEWRDDRGTIVGRNTMLDLCITTAGVYRYTVTARDGRGGVTTLPATLTITPAKEIVVYAANVSGDDDVWLSGRWRQVADPTAAGGARAYAPELGAPKVLTPLAQPANSVRVRFIADPSQTYKFWLRLKADGNHWSNDSVWVQFSGAADPGGAPIHRIGTTSGMAVNLEECLNCGVSGWGWEDDGWGAVNRNGSLLRFPGGGPQEILIQTREDGVSIDQIVLSSEQYLTARPGTAKNDVTILPRTYRVDPH